MKFLLRINREELIKFFLIDNSILTISQKVKLLRYFDGDLESIYRTSSENLKKILNKKSSFKIDRKKIELDYKKLLKKSFIKFSTIFDQDYPLKKYFSEKIPDKFLPSPVLFYIGNPEILKNNKTISVVGTRKPSEISILFTKHLIKEIVKNKVITISGFARGIDYYVHYYSIYFNGSTVGITGAGLNIVYPKSNLPLFKMFLEGNGLLISEYPPDTPPFKYNFPYRNRLIAMMGNYLFFIQGGIKSGGLITVNYASNLNKRIFVFYPDFKIKLDNFKGNEIVYSKYKGIKIIGIETSDDLIMYSNDFKGSNKIIKNKNLIIKIKFLESIDNLKKINNLSNTEKEILNTILFNPFITVSEILEKLKLSIDKFLPLLMKLIDSELIKQTYDGRLYFSYNI